MTGHPLVSVIIPAYNSAAYTVETVESVLAQTYRNFEVIVVDDGSTDHTREALAPYADRIHYLYKSNGGACSARNEGIRHAKGEYIACLDCDDLWLPDKLEYSLPVLEQNPDMGFVFSLCYTIDSVGKITGEVHYTFELEQAYLGLLMQNFVMAPTVVMRRSCLEQVGLFDESIFIPADWDLWLRLAHRFRVGYVNRPLSKYRLASNYTLRHVEQFVRETEYVLKKQFRLAGDLSTRQRNQAQQRLLVTQSLLYSQAGEYKQALRLLGNAIVQYPFSWQFYGQFGFPLLGHATWQRVHSPTVTKVLGVIKRFRSP